MDDGLHLKVFTPEQIDAIHDRCLAFLETKGVTVAHPRGARLLADAGAHVDHSNQVVRFPADVIETALRIVPRTFSLASSGGHPESVLPHPDGLFYRLGNTGEPEYLDPGSSTIRPLLRSDVAHWAQLLEALDDIALAATPFATDVPEPVADVCGIKTLFENTTKHVMIHPYSLESLPYLFELGEVMAGGNGALKRRPVISMIICALSPFTFKEMDIEALVLSARHGVPMHLFSLPLAGATSPVSLAGTILQMGIEILALVVMSQLIEPGAKVIACPFAFTLDMGTGRNLQASIEAMQIAAGAVQFFRETCHVPTHYEPGADSHVPDGHAQIEKSLSGLMAARAGCSILGGAGQLDVIRVSSPIQLIIDNDLVGVLRRLCSPIEVDDDYLAWADMLDIGPGATYLERRHTLNHCREALRPPFLATLSRDTWLGEGAKDLDVRAMERYAELTKVLKRVELPDERQRELDRIEGEARRKLVE